MRQRLRRMPVVLVALALLGLGDAVMSATTPSEPAAAGGITDVPGVKVGHFTDPRRPTGCTVVLTEAGATGGVDVRGSAPGTRETDLLNPLNLVEQVNAVVLAGGSAFGLAAADGVVRYLEERGVGFSTPVAKVPIVPAAILFDLSLGDARIRPTADSGYQAALAATAGPVAEGNVGAGAGALVGQMRGGAHAMKGGLGTASIRLPTGYVVGALVAVNAAGDIVDYRSGRIVAGARTDDGKSFADVMGLLRTGSSLRPKIGQQTTIGVVATNARLTKAQTTKVAQMAHDGLARTIYPVHTMGDGDTIFALATGVLPGGAGQAQSTGGVVGAHEAGGELDVTVIGALAAQTMADAVLRAVHAATSIPGYPAARDMRP